MRVVVVGAGPVGTLCALMLARRGHEIALVDRDPGPPVDGSTWQRRGVMQFDLPHFFRPGVRQALCAEVPELWSALLLAGGLPAQPPGFPEEMTGLQCRRRTFELAAWPFTTAEPRITRIVGHADELLREGDRVNGAVVDGARLEADLVIVASGRAGRLGNELRAGGESSACGFSYAARQYQAGPDAELPNSGMPIRHVHDGYEAIVFPQDARTLTALIVRPTFDERLLDLRHADVFDAAAAAIPLLATWTNPASYQPITEVKAGANLLNAYCGQRGADGHATAGVVFIGDAVCTTNPAAGRGVTLGFDMARMLVSLLEHDSGVGAVEQFDDWCTEHIRPWYEDHVYWDATELRRFAGEDLDLDARIPSDVVVDCAQVDPSIFAAAGPYLGMLAGPRVLDAVQDKARAVLRTGWRPAYAAGPTREELAELIARAAAVPA
jgi:2-polyprenyl-6-methoxyphenol hydroxylase-like FAD-dependent oxidoreductase